MSRADQYLITVTVDGVDWGVWDMLSGGAVDSDELKYKPGGMAPEISLGGSVSVDNITLSRLYTLDEVQQRHKQLIRGVGKAQVKVGKQSLTLDRVPTGEPDVYTGILKTVTLPDADSTSNDAAQLQIEVSSAGTIG